MLMPIAEITPTDLKALLSGDKPPLLIDVREEGEAAVCSIDGSTLIPMNTLPERLTEIPAGQQVALYCHHGMRSWMAAQWMARNGYDALSLAGGIDRWAAEIDPEMNRY
jgi:rhodanese-related sulfurtransferase